MRRSGRKSKMIQDLYSVYIFKILIIYWMSYMILSILIDYRISFYILFQISIFYY